MKCPCHSARLFIFAALAFAHLGAHAQSSYPQKAVRFVVPFAPGGPVDTLARSLAPKFNEAFGQQVIVDNRAGGGSLIGTEMVAKSPPDGYTVLVTSSAMGINPSIYPKMPYDPVKDFSPVALIAASSLIVVNHPSVPARSIKELIALGKAQPGQMIYASSGAGSAPHLAAELFLSMTGLKMVHVPYKGAAPATIDLIAGHVSLMFNNMLSGVPNVQTGRLRALAVTGAKRTAALPNLPTVAEAGVPGYEATTWYAMFTSANTPRDIVDRLNREVANAVNGADLRSRLASQGVDPVASTPEHLATYLQTEIRKWQQVAKASGAKL
jgi:tripartite-type tricarboxylate transporter receptor subunit TctC